MSGKAFPIVIVVGQPLPMPRPFLSRRGGIKPDERVKEYKKLVARYAEQVWHHELQKANPDLPLKGDCGLRLEFARETMVRADLDNLIKTVQDALLGIAYLDDHQIVELAARKTHGAKRPRVEITLYDLEAV